jgi:hypothetical protein
MSDELIQKRARPNQDPIPNGIQGAWILTKLTSEKLAKFLLSLSDSEITQLQDVLMTGASRHELRAVAEYRCLHPDWAPSEDDLRMVKNRRVNKFNIDQIIANTKSEYFNRISAEQRAALAALPEGANLIEEARPYIGHLYDSMSRYGSRGLLIYKGSYRNPSPMHTPSQFDLQRACAQALTRVRANVLIYVQAKSVAWKNSLFVAGIVGCKDFTVVGTSKRGAERMARVKYLQNIPNVWEGSPPDIVIPDGPELSSVPDLAAELGVQLESTS